MQSLDTRCDATEVNFVTLIIEGKDRPFYYRSRSSDKAVMDQTFLHKQYDMSHFPQCAKVGAYYDALIAKGSAPLIIDAGANIGASTLWLSAHFPGSHILAIEPEARNCALLRRNCEGLNYSLLEGGIGCRDGKSYLQDPGVGEWGHRLSPDGGEYEVSVFAASTVVSTGRKSGGVPFLFKIDIEGGERELFRDDLSWVAEFPVLIIELHDWLLPGTSNSKNFLKAISDLEVDVTYRGENVFVFNYGRYG